MEKRGFCWVDIETTGLDKKKDEILEIACIFTDFKLQHLSDIHTYVLWSGDKETVNPFVFNMHKETGLWDRLEAVTNAEGLSSPFTVDTLLADWISNLKDVYGLDQIMIAGSSVGQFDAVFIERDFPMFYKQLHYRVFDVTSIKLLAEMCGSPISEEKPYLPEHVARNDVKNSLHVARTFFNPFVETTAMAEHTLKVMES